MTAAMTELDARGEAMRDAGVHECPPWCLRNDEEAEVECHIGEWEIAIRDGVGQNEIKVMVRAERQWWTANDEHECWARFRIKVEGPGGATVNIEDVDFDDDLMDDLFTVLERHRERAQETLDDDWPEAFPGAAELEAAREAAAQAGTS